MSTSLQSSLALKAKLFRGFSDPSRLSIVETIGGGPRTVSDIVALTGLSQPNVSNHLSCLRDCGLVHREQRGRFVHYCLADPRVAQLLRAVDDLLSDIAADVYVCPQYAEPGDAAQ